MYNSYVVCTKYIPKHTQYTLYIPDDKYIEQSNKRLSKISQLEQHAVSQCCKDRTEAMCRVNELKKDENRFKTELEKRKGRNQMENAFNHLKIDENSQLNTNNQPK